MTSDTEQQQQQHTSLSLLDENKDLSSKMTKNKLKVRQSRKNYCTEDYIVGYGVPALIIVLVIVLFILAFIVIRNYNKNCSNTKEERCRGMLWYFT